MLVKKIVVTFSHDGEINKEFNDQLLYFLEFGEGGINRLLCPAHIKDNILKDKRFYPPKYYGPLDIPEDGEIGRLAGVRIFIDENIQDFIFLLDRNGPSEKKRICNE